MKPTCWRCKERIINPLPLCNGIGLMIPQKELTADGRQEVNVGVLIGLPLNTCMACVESCRRWGMAEGVRAEVK